MKLALSLPEGWESRAAVAAVAGARGSAFADGELRVGTHFNARMWDPVSQAKFFDDRPWSAVDAFARGVVQGTADLANLSPARGIAGIADAARPAAAASAWPSSAPAALAPAGVSRPGRHPQRRAPRPKSLEQTWQTPQTHVPRPSGV